MAWHTKPHEAQILALILGVSAISAFLGPLEIVALMILVTREFMINHVSLHEPALGSMIVYHLE